MGSNGIEPFLIDFQSIVQAPATPTTHKGEQNCALVGSLGIEPSPVDFQSTAQAPATPTTHKDIVSLLVGSVGVEPTTLRAST